MFFALLDLYFYVIQSHTPLLTYIFTYSSTYIQAYPEFVAHLERLADAMNPLLDAPPVDIPGFTSGSLRRRVAAAKTLMPIFRCGGLVYLFFKHFLFSNTSLFSKYLICILH